MRVIVYGVGAIGGTVAAALALAGEEVLGIARGDQLEAIRSAGLRFASVNGTATAHFDCVAHPGEIAFRPDDAILLTMKTQDTPAALQALRDAGVADQPIYCVQNGVANERMAARRFANVHGVTVMMPAGYVQAGEVAAFCGPRYGIFDLGRYPHGQDGADAALAAVLTRGNIAAFALDDVMASKYGKLLMNLRNILEASLGRGVDQGSVATRMRAEAERVLQAAGIVWRDVGAADPRRDALLKSANIPGVIHQGGSTTQSLLRGTGSLETDWLNGEIALLGRLHGEPAPINSLMTQIAARLSRAGAKPGKLSLADIEAELAAAGLAT